jgi:ssDNA-binding Zn-finger/Zn-ribbon topoisomerase 1
MANNKKITEKESKNTKKSKNKNFDKKQQQSVRKCNKCGANLRYIPGTNVWVCDGKVKVFDKDTKEYIIADCGHYALSRRAF